MRATLQIADRNRFIRAECEPAAIEDIDGLLGSTPIPE
jgi:hypothetical protein